MLTKQEIHEQQSAFNKSISEKAGIPHENLKYDDKSVFVNTYYRKDPTFRANLDLTGEETAHDAMITDPWGQYRYLVSFWIPTKDDIDEMLEDVYCLMQGEVWSKNGEARDLIRAKKLTHTSMSIGDIIEIYGRYFEVAPSGFNHL